MKIHVCIDLPAIESKSEMALYILLAEVRNKLRKQRFDLLEPLPGTEEWRVVPIVSSNQTGPPEERGRAARVRKHSRSG
jgi:hypothetical protein